MLFALRVPAGNERGPAYMDQVLAALHRGNPEARSFFLEIGLYRGSTTLFIDARFLMPIPKPGGHVD